MRRFAISAIFAFSVLLVATACGGIEAVRDAGEKIRGSDASEPANDEHPSEEQAQATGEKTRAPGRSWRRSGIRTPTATSSPTSSSSRTASTPKSTTAPPRGAPATPRA